MFKQKVVLYPLLITLVAAPLVGGCTASKKPITPTPAPRTTPAPAPAPTPSNTMPPGTTTRLTPVTPAPADTNREAKRLATMVAKVKNVRSATVVLTGTTASVGLDIASNVTGTKVDTVKKDAANVIRRENKRITSVYVATDADTVTRLKRIATGINKGTPLSSFAKEINDIQRRIVPIKR